MSEAQYSDEVEERFQALESKILYQDRTVDELNDVVTKQQDQIDRLTNECKHLRETLESVSADGVAGREEPPPPHY